MHPFTVMLSAAAISLTGLPPAHIAPAGTQASGRELFYGGFTSQGWPVAVDISRDRRTVKHAAIAGYLACPQGGYGELDPYGGIPLSRTGAFDARFKDALVRWKDGSFDVYSGHLTGKANAAQTKLTGTWRLHDEVHDTSGAVVDQCDSGTVRWTARR